MAARLLILFLVALLSAGCAGTGDKNEDELARLDAQKLLAEGKKQQGKKNYEFAIESYEKLQSRYPFSPEAQEAQIETAYSYYKMNESDSAILAANDFLKTNPRHPRADYAHYLKGQINQDRYKNMLDKFVNRDIADLDVSAMETAFNDFKILIRRYPDSQYVDDARQRMVFLRNAMARHELKVAEYYVKRRAWVAVANRCQYLLENYDRADSMPQALGLLARAYQELGAEESRKETLLTLRANYPELASKIIDKYEIR